MARSIWSGTLSFGLVNVPIRLVTAVRDKSIHFNMLSPDGQCRLRRKLVCPETDKEYDFKDTARGYEIAPGQYVLINEEELNQVKPESGRTIDIQQFAALDEIDPIYFERTYYLTPDEAGVKGYELLAEVMRKTKKAAIAQMVMRQKEYLVLIREHDGVLHLHTMHYADEVVAVDDLDEKPADVKLPKKELDVAEKLVDALTDTFDASAYHDRYREQIEELIEAKAEGEEVSVVSGGEEEPAPSMNIMDALKKSLQGAQKNGKSASSKSTKSTTKKKSGARRKSA